MPLMLEGGKLFGFLNVTQNGDSDLQVFVAIWRTDVVPSEIKVLSSYAEESRRNFSALLFRGTEISRSTVNLTIFTVFENCSFAL